MTDINTPVADNDLNVHDKAEIDEIMNFDFDRVSTLLGVVEKCYNVAPKATSIPALALAAIDSMNEEAKDIARRRGDRVREAEQRRFEAEQRKRADEAEKQRADAEKAQAEKQQRIDALAAQKNDAPPKNGGIKPPPQGGEPSPNRRV